MPWNESSQGEKFALRTKRLGAAAGGQKIGCSLFELEPGKRAFPYHAHMANEEVIYVLAGEGTLRIGGQEVPVREGDYIAMPPGPECAHQLVNTSNAPLRYLCISTMQEPEVVLYPDSNKLGALANKTRYGMFMLDKVVGYYHGEE
jgi:uncharacterized cupin superfamily protein